MKLHLIILFLYSVQICLSAYDSDTNKNNFSTIQCQLANSLQENGLRTSDIATCN